MVNSTLKNSLARRNHKERSQPVHRARLGLLEKHKDYVHRARDYKSKQDRLKKLREKAAFRNKDEFYFGMVKSQTKNGVAIAERGNVSLNTDLVKLLKTQDLGYVKVQIAKDEKKIVRLRAELEITTPVAGPSSEWTAASELAEVEKLAEMGIVLEPQSTSRKGKGKGKAALGHIVFVDEASELQSYGSTSRIESQSDDHEEEEDEAVDLGWAIPEQKKGKMKVSRPTVEIDEEAALEEAQAHRMEVLTDLSAHLSRLRLLRQAEAKLEATKGLMGKGAATRVRNNGWVEDESMPEDKNGERKRWEGKMWKWKLERRR